MAKVLLVDDSNFSRRVLRRIIEPAGHDIREAEDGLSALEQYALDRPDLVLLDMNMAGMNGLDVLLKLRELDPGAVVVIATADIQNSTRLLSRDGGARGFISKPFVAENVLATLEAILAGGGNASF
ncbi:MAG TPA: response regulator [Herpetosiphonaceae bacterium]|nr:response regulator [Herpetosiphonaceae bacterium]